MLRIGVIGLLSGAACYGGAAVGELDASTTTVASTGTSEGDEGSTAIESSSDGSTSEGDPSSEGSTATGSTGADFDGCAYTHALALDVDADLPGRGMSLAWSPLGDAIAVGGHFRDSTTGQRYDSRISATSDGAFLRAFDCHYYWVIAQAWIDHPELGPVLADGGYDHAVKLWAADGPGSDTCEPGQFEAEHGALHRLDELDGATTGLAFSPDRTLLAATNRDRTVRLWRISEGEGHLEVVKLWFDEPAGNFVSLAWDPLGRWLVTGDKQLGRVAVWSFDAQTDLWDADTRTAFAALSYEQQGSWYRNHADAVTRTPTWGDEGHGTVWGVDASPDGTRVVAAAAEGSLAVYEAMSGEVVFRVELDQELHSVDWHPDGGGIVAGGEGTLAFVSESGTLDAVRPDHADVVSAVAWSPDGCALASTAGGMRISGVGQIHDEVDGPDTRLKIWR